MKTLELPIDYKKHDNKPKAAFCLINLKKFYIWISWKKKTCLIKEFFILIFRESSQNFHWKRSRGPGTVQAKTKTFH